MPTVFTHSQNMRVASLIGALLAGGVGACDAVSNDARADAQIALPDGGGVDAQSVAQPGSGASEPDGGLGDAGTQGQGSSADAAGNLGAADAGAARDAAVSVDASVDASAVNRADAGPVAGDRCDVAVSDPAKPPSALMLSGNLGTHDPALLEQDGVFYLWHTGPRLPGKTSSNLMNWQAASSALGASNPAWIAQQVPGATDLWAPDVSFFGGQYHLYYSVSTFGSNSSCIGHATRASLKTGVWNDLGSVVCSNHGSKDDWNAIDPNLIVDAAGTPWLVFGSFWSGIKAVELDASGARKDGMLHALASRGGGAIEGPFVVRRCGYYYLFVSFDRCCDGVNSTYNIRVGRSQNVLGPYVDRDGIAMMNGGGSVLVAGAGRWHGPGHNAVIFSGNRAYNVYHAYDGDNAGNPTLRVAELVWDAQGWPTSGGP